MSFWEVEEKVCDVRKRRSVFQDKFVYIYDTSGYMERNKNTKFLSLGQT